MNERLNRADWSFIGICAAVFALSLFIVLKWFAAAFPEASIDFRYDRAGSLRVAAPFLAAQHVDVRGMKHAATFDSDDTARIFLERSVGLKKASAILRGDVHLWWWSHRWFRPLQEEEFRVDVAPTGEVVAFSDRIPEDRALPSPDLAGARAKAEAFLATVRVPLGSLQLVAQSERRLPHRIQRIFTYEAHAIHPAGAPYRFTITVDGDRVSRYSQRVRVPDQWIRDYGELRSRNLLAGNIDLIFLIATIIAALVVFIVRLLRGDAQLRMLLGIGIASIVLVTGVALNSFPSALAGYDTTTSYPAFLAQFGIGALLQGLGVAMLLIVIVGSGEVLYRERLPNQLAMSRLWNVHALTSKRVFRSFVLAYTLVAFFLGYQVAFYVIADKFGAWAPAEVPYDEILNSALPWVAVLFAGFFPALSEEFLSRAFSIPLFERLFRSRIAAIVAAGFIWGFGHATYPNQPFYIRGLEVGTAGVFLGFLLFRFGLLPLVIWHYTVDALYTALLLLRSGNRYYVVSGALSSLVFVVPMLVSIALYIRNRGFVPDEELSNAAVPVKPAPLRVRREEAKPELPPRTPLARTTIAVCIAAVVLAAALAAVGLPSMDDVIDYRTTIAQAKRIAAGALPSRGTHTIATPVEGFRSWDRESGREDGGSPGGFDATAAAYMLRSGLAMQALVDTMRTKIEAATWMVRSFTPFQKEEYFVEVDPRAARVIGYHKYQDEKRPGPRLEQAQAVAIAQGAFAQYGIPWNDFALKEALSFQQPNRRDWLLHFEERRPIVANAFRRVSVRVAGNEVTQFATTVKIPDEVYRQPTTLLNTLFTLLRILGGLSLLSLIIAGLVVALRRGHFPWQLALRWTAVLAIIPILATLARRERMLFEYSTSIQWNTFITDEVTTAVRNIGLQLGMLFLAIVALEVAYPAALSLWRRPMRARFGRGALVAAAGVLGLAAVRREILQWIADHLPASASVQGFDVPEFVALPLPSLLLLGDAAVRTIIGAAAIGLFVVALRGLRARPWLPSAVAVVTLFLITLDPGVTGAQTPLMLASAASAALLGWVAVRYILGRNLLAYPLTIALGTIGSNAASLLQNHRADLRAHGIVAIAVLLALVIWVAVPRELAVADPHADA